MSDPTDVRNLLQTSWILPVGVHELSLDAIESIFVDEAPRSRNRSTLFRAFRLWYEQVMALFPDSRVWIDGGFTTYKATIPEDVDTVIWISPDDIDQMQEAEYIRFERMFSDKLNDYKPFGGLVDAYWADPKEPQSVQYWADFLASVRDDSKNIDPSLRKGFLEVKN